MVIPLVGGNLPQENLPYKIDGKYREISLFDAWSSSSCCVIREP